MMKHAMVAAVALGLIALAVPSFAQDQSIAYVGGIGDVQLDCTVVAETGYCIGGVLFTGLPGGSHGLLLDDEVLDPIGGAYSGTGAPQNDFCGSVRLPSSFSGGDLAVWVDGPIYGSGLGVLGMTCPDVQVATTGMVHICFNRAC